ncbi:MAG: CHC2 zinc finger domain-containing protein, partial [Mucinivorans sp.]
MIDKLTIDRIFAAADIAEVVGDFVQLKRKGVNYTACCPFHNEKTPSFIVSPAKGLYKCFGCGKGGGAVN